MLKKTFICMSFLACKSDNNGKDMFHKGYNDIKKKSNSIQLLKDKISNLVKSRKSVYTLNLN